MLGPEDKRIGVLGGTFDPPHLGHLVAAVNVAHELELDRVLFVVANVPWQKIGTRSISDAADRLDMVDVAVDRVEGLVVSDMELQRGGESYTADTLLELKELRPDAELYVIVGSDVAAQLGTWKRNDEVRRLATTVVLDRPGNIGGRPPAGWTHVVVETPLIDVSSTDLRDRVEQGRPIDYLVPSGVASIIRDRELYR